MMASQHNDLRNQWLENREPPLPRSAQTVCLSRAVLTLPTAWPQYSCPSALTGLSMRPFMSGPLFTTCVILCTLGMNPITEVACFLLSLLFSPAHIARVYNTGDQNLPKAFGSRRKGDFFPTKITQHGTLILQVTVVIKSCLAPMRSTCVCVCMMWLCHDTSIYLHLFAFLNSDRKSCAVFIANECCNTLRKQPCNTALFLLFSEERMMGFSRHISLAHLAWTWALFPFLCLHTLEHTGHGYRHLHTGMRNSAWAPAGFN